MGNRAPSSSPGRSGSSARCKPCRADTACRSCIPRRRARWCRTACPRPHRRFGRLRRHCRLQSRRNLLPQGSRRVRRRRRPMRTHPSLSRRPKSSDHRRLRSLRPSVALRRPWKRRSSRRRSSRRRWIPRRRRNRDRVRSPPRSACWCCSRAPSRTRWLDSVGTAHRRSRWCHKPIRAVTRCSPRW
jgi:hypothetical protein